MCVCRRADVSDTFAPTPPHTHRKCRQMLFVVLCLFPWRQKYTDVHTNFSFWSFFKLLLAAIVRRGRRWRSVGGHANAGAFFSSPASFEARWGSAGCLLLPRGRGQCGPSSVFPPSGVERTLCSGTHMQQVETAGSLVGPGP